MSARRAAPNSACTKGVQCSWRSENCGPKRKVYALPLTLGGRSLMRYAPISATRLNQRLMLPAIAPSSPCQLKVSLTLVETGTVGTVVFVEKRTKEYPTNRSTAGWVSLLLDDEDDFDFACAVNRELAGARYPVEAALGSGEFELVDALAASSAKSGVNERDPRTSVARKRATNLILAS